MPAHACVRLSITLLDQGQLASCKAGSWKDVFTTLLSVQSNFATLNPDMTVMQLNGVRGVIIISPRISFTPWDKFIRCSDTPYKCVCL